MLDRRFSVRVRVSFPTRMRVADGSGKTVKEDTVLDNLSEGGAYFRLKRRVCEGSHVSIAVRLSTVTDSRVPALRLAARGTVLRTERQNDGRWGVAVEFGRRRVL
jgi:hypothetical protein